MENLLYGIIKYNSFKVKLKLFLSSDMVWLKCKIVTCWTLNIDGSTSMNYNCIFFFGKLKKKSN